MIDPNPLATGPTKWRAEHCTTHHHACDCREFENAETIGRLDEEICRLREAMQMTIDENLELADGDVCTLMHLKRALAT